MSSNPGEIVVNKVMPFAPVRGPRDLQIADWPIDGLKPHPKNARTHSQRQLHQIARSIEAFGFIVPVVIDDESRILAGHGRVEAAKGLGLKTVPTIRIDDLNEKEKQAYLIADNRIAELATWDPERLTEALTALVDDATMELDPEVTGFDWASIDVLTLGGDVEEKGRAKILGKTAKAEKPSLEDLLVEPDPENPAVSQPGTLWLLGEHRLLVGDAIKRESYETLLRGDDGMLEEVALVFTDPPYNVSIAGHVSGLGAVAHREFAMASGEMSQAEFTGFLNTVFGLMAEFSRDGALHFICMDWRHMREVLDASEGVYGELKNVCVWNKDNAGMGALYRSKHEFVFVQKVGQGQHVNNVQLGGKGRYRTNVWDYAGVNSFSGRADLEMHPTVKPVALIADAIRDCSKRHQIVLDPFGGAGSTLIAAHKTKRKARLIEIDPLYADTIVRRWQKLTDGAAVEARSGSSFAEVAERKRNIS